MIASAVAAMLAATGPAQAQDRGRERQRRSEGPFAGLFAIHQGEEPRRRLDLRGALFGGYEDNQLDSEEGLPGLNRRIRTSGASPGANGSLAFSRRGDRVRFTADGTAVVRQYTSGEDFTAGAYHAGSSLSVNVAPRLTLASHGSFQYSPFYQFTSFQNDALADGGLAANDFRLAALAERNTNTNANVSLRSNFTRRSSIAVEGEWREWRFLDHSDDSTTTWGGGVRVSHNLTRAVGVHAGYLREQADFRREAPSAVNETIDVGVDYGSTLAFSRRTTLAFSASTGAVRYQRLTRYRVNGNATLARAIRRTWSSELRYRRDTEFMAGFLEPVFSDAVAIGAGGLLATRVKLQSAVGYYRGVLAFSDATRFSTYSGSSRLELALSRRVGLYGQYAYYRYELPVNASGLSFLPRFSRQTVTAGLTLWVPIINDVRSPRDSR